MGNGSTATYETTGKLNVQRYFSREGISPFDRIEWVRGDVDIADEAGAFLFKQRDAESPRHFSPLARKIIFSRYSYGENGTPERENSLRQIIGRISETYARWAVNQGYMSPEDATRFGDEIAEIKLGQRASFNSPVLFNVGTDRYASRKSHKTGEGYHIKDGKAVIIPAEEAGLYPQTSACFIQSVLDDMDDIMYLAAREARLYKFGSGTGTDLSTLRSSREKLSGGGRPSGPLAYQMFYDRVAGIVKSGGKTRRAAQMKSLRIDHPDILEFIESKEKEEAKAKALVAAGYSEREAAETIAFQNANFSIRVTDDFMKSVQQGLEWRTRAVHNHEMDDQKDEKGNWLIPRYDARTLIKKIAKAAWTCGDPGLQFDDTINNHHTCPNSDRIKASNPCSEYMFLDDSSCNLSSINIMKFRNEDGSFDVRGFRETVRTMVYAMDLNYDNSSFPTAKIADNSHKFRPLGLGYANMGAYIMSLGLAYDSDEGRAVAASLTALLNATAYETSAEMAGVLGPFEEYEKNRDPMMKVIEGHRDALMTIDRKKLPAGLENILDEAERVSEEMVRKGRRHGFRNAQATVIAPTGTIGFFMDCDTKGIEPELALVQYKKLAEGGVLRMVNQTVPIALQTLKYTPDQIKDIINYVGGHAETNKIPGLKEGHFETAKKLREDVRLDISKVQEEFKKLGYDKNEAQKMALYLRGHETMDGAPHIKPEHLSVFDTSFEPAYKQTTNARFIPYAGHIKMMAACQPFVSGAISKTVNMPESTTIEDIEDAYMQAWKLGLKALAIYRDKSKSWQPQNTSQLEKKLVLPKPARVKLPTTVESRTHRFSIAGGGIVGPNGEIIEADYEGYFTLGFYDDRKTPGEVFITMAHEGSLVRGLMDTIGTMASLALQHGVPWDAFSRKFHSSKFEPYGRIKRGHPDIHTATSIVQYIFDAGQKIIEEQEARAESGDDELKIPAIVTSSDGSSKRNEEKLIPAGKFCPNCSGQLIKGGGCEVICPACNYQDFSGCGG